MLNDRVDHDRIFKELLQTFFIEFLELFFPEVLSYLDRNSIVFLDKEIFTDVTSGEKHEVDLLVKVKFLGQNAYFLIHLENQSVNRSKFNRRFFRYFSRLLDTHELPIYPIAIFSYDLPKRAEIDNFKVEFPNFEVLTFNFKVLQLNRLNWKDYLNSHNPVASALMAKMDIKAEDRPKVKAECLRLLVTLKLNPAKMQLISGFVDTYLELSAKEELVFRQQLDKFLPKERQQAMEIITSWMRQGLEQGLQQGLEQGKELGQKQMVLHLLKKRIGDISELTQEEIKLLNQEKLNDLAEALFNFSNSEDLKKWLELNKTS